MTSERDFFGKKNLRWNGERKGTRVVLLGAKAAGSGYDKAGMHDMRANTYTKPV